MYGILLHFLFKREIGSSNSDAGGRDPKSGAETSAQAGAVKSTFLLRAFKPGRAADLSSS